MRAHCVSTAFHCISCRLEALFYNIPLQCDADSHTLCEEVINNCPEFRLKLL